MKYKKRILIVILGSFIAMSAVACTKSSDALDPMGYAAAGYYGKTSEELKELLPEAREGGTPCLVLESTLSESVKCKQVFYFNDNRLEQIQYQYLFENGEEAEKLFVEQCKRISELDRNAQPSGCARYSQDGDIITKVDEIETGFWDKMVEWTVDYPKTIGYATYCDEENSRRVNREAEPEGWNNEYNIKVEAGFYHIDIDRETGERKESDAEFLDGKEARIILTIGTWD